jgi:hypothetical protein
MTPTGFEPRAESSGKSRIPLPERALNIALDGDLDLQLAELQTIWPMLPAKARQRLLASARSMLA